MFGIYGEGEMEDGGCHEGDYGQEGDGEKEDEGPGYVVFFLVEVMDEEDQDGGDDDGGEQLAES